MKSIVCYETQHGSAKRLATAIADKLGCLCVNVDTPFQAEDETVYDALVLVFGFRGPYTAQLTKLFLQKMAGKLNYKHLIVAGEGLFSEKEFPSVAEGLKAIATPASFHSFFMKGQLRVATLTPEEQALLAKFSELTGMEIVDMGEFSEDDAKKVADEIFEVLEKCPVLEDPNAGKKRWICSVCGYIHTGEEPPATCPVCKQTGDIFKPVS